MEAATAMIGPPVTSLEQRRAALRKANRIRSLRAELKRSLRTQPSWAATRKARSLILDPPAYVQTMQLWDLLLALPKYGRVKVNRMLVAHRVSPSKTIGGLSDRQRHEIASVITAR